MYDRGREHNTRSFTVAQKALVGFCFVARSRYSPGLPGIHYVVEIALKVTLFSSLSQWNERIVVYTPTSSFWRDSKVLVSLWKALVIVGGVDPGKKNSNYSSMQRKESQVPATVSKKKPRFLEADIKYPLNTR